MSENFGIGNNFDSAWKNARQQLIAQGNSTPTTQDILHYLIDKYKQQPDPQQVIVPGFHLEANDLAPTMKYGCNITCNLTMPTNQEAINMKYGANLPTENPAPTMPSLNVAINMKYGINLPTENPAPTMPSLNVPINMKYGANLPTENPAPTTSTMPVPVYGLNLPTTNILPTGVTAPSNPLPNVNIGVKYGVNIGCKPLKINNKLNAKFEAFLKRHTGTKVAAGVLVVDRNTHTIKIANNIKQSKK